jgi:hypothetical protein
MSSNLAAMIQNFEDAAKVSLPFFRARDPDYDAHFYDTALLTGGEREQAYASTAPEGSIVIVQPGSESVGFDVCACPDEDLGGEARAREVVALFDAYCSRNPRSAIHTVVIPGCGSSPVGAVALAKTAANALGQPVAGIISGRGQLDTMFEVASGGMLMGPMARFFSFIHPALQVLAQTGKFATWARHETRELCSVIHEAATLLALLRARVIIKDETGIALRPAHERGLQMIVGHSKANWAVLVALLNFELDIVRRLRRPTSVDRHIDVVTFGNPVDLPDAEPFMQEIFHYHQFMGSRDILAMMNVLPQMWMGWYWSRKCGEPTAKNCVTNPDERLIPGCEHNLIAANPTHMPIERLLPLIRDN